MSDDRAKVEERITWAYQNCAMGQDRWELALLCHAIRELRPRNVLEIGTKAGGWIASVAAACPREAQFIAVDISPLWAVERQAVSTLLASEAQSVEWFVGNSGSAHIIERVRAAMPIVDVLHIDGDHAYGACESDWNCYSPLVRHGGLVVFHDLMHAQDVGVGQFWAHLRQTFATEGKPWRASEFVNPGKNRASLPASEQVLGLAMGTGVLYV